MGIVPATHRSVHSPGSLPTGVGKVKLVRQAYRMTMRYMIWSCDTSLSVSIIVLRFFKTVERKLSTCEMKEKVNNSIVVFKE